MAFVEDPSAFINDNTPGYFVATVTVGGATVEGIFDNDYAEFLDVGSTTPMLLCSAAGASLIALKALLTIAGVSYKAITKKPDSLGSFVTIILEKQ